MPGTTNIYVLYHPDDEVSVTSIASLREAVAILKVELVLDEVSSPEEVVAAIGNLLLQGIAPADLPVETAEIFLGINLKTAKAIGLDIPDEVLRQADTIIH
jgi:putative ABC transport system substrate-binding protein